MYTAKKDTFEIFGNKGWSIIDACGYWLCTLPNEQQAQALLVHLNRI